MNSTVNTFRTRYERCIWNGTRIQLDCDSVINLAVDYITVQKAPMLPSQLFREIMLRMRFGITLGRVCLFCSGSDF